MEKQLWEKVYDSFESPLAERIALLPAMNATQLDQLFQLITPVYDGNVMSKQTRSELVDMQLVDRWQGINFCNRNGYAVLYLLGHLEDRDRFVGGKPWKNWKTYARREA